ncbi:MAG TPA: MBL fold metallo-hydrolase [Vicinamibacterales bacterium]
MAVARTEAIALRKRPTAVDRRRFLAATIAAPFVAATRRAETGAVIDRGFARVTRLADGVFATIADPQLGLQCYSNGGVIVGRDAVLIVEGHFTAEGAALEMDAARTLSKAPIRGVVNTHYHLDHTFGNIGYARHGVPILAHDGVEPLMRQNYKPLDERARAAWLAPWERRVAGAHDAVDRSRMAGDLEQISFIGQAVDHVSLAFPTEALDPKHLPMTIDLGRMRVTIEFHPGHSPTDLIVIVGDRGIVFTGDLFFSHAYPVVPDANIVAWRRVLDTFMGYDRSTQFVPGHGPVGRLAQVREQAAIMDDLREHAERMMQRGASVEEAERTYAVPRPFESFEVLCWGFTVGGAMRGYYAAHGHAREDAQTFALR